MSPTESLFILPEGPGPRKSASNLEPKVVPNREESEKGTWLLFLTAATLRGLVSGKVVCPLPDPRKIEGVRKSNQVPFRTLSGPGFARGV